MLQDELEELRDNAVDSLISFSKDPSHHDRLSQAFPLPAFQHMQDWMIYSRVADQHMFIWTYEH